MKKRIVWFIFVLVLCASFAMPVLAANTVDYVVDDADLLTDFQESTLAAKLEEISHRQKLDVVVVTTDGLYGESAMDYADDYFDYNGYGYGENRDGILLLVSMEDRDWWISTRGYGITAFTDAGIDYLSEQFLPDLSDGNYAQAFNTYAEECDAFITQARTKEPYDRSNLPRKPFPFIAIPISIVAGLVIALISVGSMKGQMKTVRRQQAASNYVRNGSMKVTESSDLFLYKHVSRTARPKNNSSGSSTHRSSSGATHGGRGGKF